MIVETKVIYTEEDKALLRKTLPDNPCDRCYNKIACCGCPSGREYEQAVKAYKDNNIYDIALTLKAISLKEREIKKLQDEARDLKISLPAELFDLAKPMDCF